MATRLYFTGNAFAGPAYPADANWNDITQSTTQSSDMATTPDGDAAFTQTAQKNNVANPHTILHIRYRFALPTGVTLSGNIRGQFFAQDVSGAGRAMRAISVRVFDSGTTLRANLIQEFPTVLASAWNGTLTNKNFPPSMAIAAPYTTVAGDVLVVEVGTKWFTAATGGTVVGGIRFGDPGLDGDLPVDETTGVAAPEQNGWIEFESVNLFGQPDNYLLTLSGSDNLVRPAAPDKRGLHFVDIATRSTSFWDGVSWKRLFQESLATLADRAKLLTLTDDAAYSALLTANNSFGVGSRFSTTISQKGLSLIAPGGTEALCIGPNATMGRGAYSDSDLMLHGLVSIASANRVHGWNLIGLTATGTGGIIGIEMTVTDTPSGASTQVLRGLDITLKANNANSNGAITLIRVVQSPYSGNSATRGAVILFDALAPTSYLNQTVAALTYFSISQQPSVGTITGLCAGLNQAVAFSLGTPRRAVRGINSIELIANPAGGAAVGRFIANVFDRGFMYRDNQGSPHYWEVKCLADGTPIVSDTGTTLPNT